MGSPQENKPRVPLSPSLWLAALGRQLRRAALRTRALETEAGPARDRAKQWLGKTTERTKIMAGHTATAVATAVKPAALETKRGLGLLRRRARHTAALVGVPWLKVGAGAALLLAIGFLAFQPRDKTQNTPTTARRMPIRTNPRGIDAAVTTAPAPERATIAAVSVMPPAAAKSPANSIPAARRAATANPSERQPTTKQRNLERRKQAYYKRAEKWHKKHSKRGKKDDDD